MTPIRKRKIQAETLSLTLLEMSNKIRALQRANSQLKASRDKWAARARAAERRVR